MFARRWKEYFEVICVGCRMSACGWKEYFDVICVARRCLRVVGRQMLLLYVWVSLCLSVWGTGLKGVVVVAAMVVVVAVLVVGAVEAIILT